MLPLGEIKFLWPLLAMVSVTIPTARHHLARASSTAISNELTVNEVLDNLMKVSQLAATTGNGSQHQTATGANLSTENSESDDKSKLSDSSNVQVGPTSPYSNHQYNEAKNTFVNPDPQATSGGSSSGQQTSNHRYEPSGGQSNGSNELRPPAARISNSYGNQAIDPNSEFRNNQTTTSLVQNLTASLFPVEPNLTLQMLSQLLNGSYQQQQQQRQLILNQTAKSYQHQQRHQPFASGPVAGSLTSTSFLEPAISLLDNARRLHENRSNSIRSYQLPFFKTTTRANNGQQQQQQSPLKQPQIYQSTQYQAGSTNRLQEQPYNLANSNNYNTYLPHKDQSSYPTVAANQFNPNLANIVQLYEQLENGYKLPFAFESSRSQPLNSFAQQQQQLQHQQQLKPNQDRLAVNQANSNNYQYIQQHNMNNQNLLDKVVYHSTPFRPAIASPNNANEVPSDKQQQQFSQNQQQQVSKDIEDGSELQYSGAKGEANKPVAVSASLQSTSSSESNKSEPISSKTSQVSIKAAPSEESLQTGPSTNNQTSSGSGEKGVEQQQQNGAKASSSNNNNNNETSSGDSEVLKPSPLLELYEREIDKQIQEALERHTSPFASLASRLAVASTNWLDKTNLIPPFYEPNHADSSYTSWARPVLWSAPPGSAQLQQQQHHHHNLQPTTSASDQQNLLSTYGPNRPLRGQQVTSESILEALQELPSMFASDLHHFGSYPSDHEPAYSLLSSPSSVHESSSLTGVSQFPNLISLNTQPDIDFSKLYIRGATNLLDSSALQQYNFGQHPLGAPLYSASSSTQPAVTSIPRPSQSPASPSRLPTMLFTKLQASPLSSLLANPLSQLYASLPKYRSVQKAPNGKGPTRNKQQLMSMSSSSIHPSHHSLVSPNGFFALANGQIRPSAAAASLLMNNQRGLLSAGSLHNPKQAGPIGNQAPYSQFNQNQNQQQQVDALHELLVSAQNPALQQLLGHQQDRLHVAATSSNPSSASQADTPSLLTASSLLDEPVALPLASWNFHSSPQNIQMAAALPASPLTLIWRSLLAPSHWVRKQTQPAGSPLSSSSSPSSSLSSSNPLLLAQASGSSISRMPLPTSANTRSQKQLVSTLLEDDDNGGGASGVGKTMAPVRSLYGPLSQLFGLPPHSTLLSGGSQRQNQFASRVAEKPKIKIKFIKIPVAFYEQPNGLAKLQLASSPGAASTVLPQTGGESI